MALQPSTKRYDVYDHAVPGLCLRVTEKGAKSFSVFKRVKGGKPERITLGKLSDLTVEQARNQAKEIIAKFAQGVNLAEVKRSLRAEPTFSEALETLLREKEKRDGSGLAEKTKRDYRDLLRLHFARFGDRRLSEISTDDVRELFRKLSASSREQANKAVRVISSVYNFMAADHGFSGENPAARVRTLATKARKTWVEAEQLPRLMDAIQAHRSEGMRDYFLLLLLTGARRANLCEMRWSNVDLDEAQWFIPKTKNGTSQLVPLSNKAMAILRRRRENADKAAVFVFPANSKSGHLTEPSSAWAEIRAEAGLKDVRIHDLRRTNASWQLRVGSNMQVISKALNHQSLESTKIYAHAEDSLVRASVEKASEEIWRVATRRPLASGGSARLGGHALGSANSDIKGAQS